jgi:hypothetical protein
MTDNDDIQITTTTETINVNTQEEIIDVNVGENSLNIVLQAGTQGKTGEQGPIGPEGPQGEKGERGVSLVIFGITTDGAEKTIVSGEKGRIVSRYTGTINSWALTTKNDESGSIVFNIKKNGTSLIGSGTKPNLSSQSSNTSEISDWDSVSITKGDIINFEVDSSTVKWINLNLEVYIE